MSGPAERVIAATKRREDYLRERSSSELRDRFAMAALPALIEAAVCGVGSVTNDATQDIADDAYALADAMLKAREVKP